MDLKKMIFYGVQFRWQRVKGIIGRFTMPRPKVMDSIQTIRKIREEGCSIARLGDGEFNLIYGQKIGFQNANDELAKELKRVLLQSNPKCLIGIPDVFGSLSDYRTDSRHFWESYLGRNRKKMLLCLNMSTTYANTNVTRFQTGYRDKQYTLNVINELKSIWRDKELVFIEGEKTRLGVGNDLFAGARQIERVLVPATNAFEKRMIIIDWVRLNISKDKLVILACGPTATIIALKLCEEGFQALDLGHIDIQYEYFLKGITKKQAIKGKYVNESVELISEEEILDEKYNAEIITKLI